jgi:hypothetical protein
MGRAELLASIRNLLDSGALTASRISPDGEESSVSEGDLTGLASAFLDACSLFLKRTTQQLEADDPANRYALGDRPPAAMQIRLQETVGGPSLKTVILSAPLEQILQGLLEGLDRDLYLRLSCPSGAADGSLQTVPDLVAERDRSEGRDPKENPPMRLAATGASFMSMSRAMQPKEVAAPSAAALIKSGLARPVVASAGPIRQVAIDDVLIGRPDILVPLALPILDRPDAAIWPDRRNSGEYWYAPVFEVLAPAMNASPSESPFLFVYKQSGVTADGQPGLNGSIRFGIRSKRSDATSAALQAAGNPPAQPVPMSGLSVALELPFRDGTGATVVQRFPASVNVAGDRITATLSLLDNWVKLCYGALAYPNFQTQPARLSISYAFRGYVSVSERDLALVYGGKFALTRAEANGGATGKQAFLDSKALALRWPEGEMRFIREAPANGMTGDAPERRASTAVATLAARPAVSVRPAATAVAAGAAVVSRPNLESQAILQKVLQRTRFAIQTQARQESLEALFPCGDDGAFYQQTTDDGPVSIGCRDALKLGQTEFRQYQIVPELNDPLYSVYRSLQQPGRFLVLPAAYRITRYAAGEGPKAYRPIIFVHAAVDPATATNTRYLFEATLQPDLPPYARSRLLAGLAGFAQNPVIDFPGDIECQMEFAWTVDHNLQVSAETVRLPDGFRVSFATDASSALLLQSLLETTGILGSAKFSLPDGSSLSSELEVSLNDITGPWDTGPLAIAVANGSASVTNSIERKVAVSQLLATPGPGAGQVVGVDRTLGPGESASLPVPAGTAHVDAVYTIQSGDPATLQEIRSFVEDIHSNVEFINLINYANHGIKQLSIKARIKGVDGEYPLSISEEQPVSAVDMLLPLSAYLQNQTLQFQVAKTPVSGPVVTTPWLEWDLASRGNVVSLTWEMIA